MVVASRDQRLAGVVRHRQSRLVRRQRQAHAPRTRRHAQAGLQADGQAHRPGRQEAKRQGSSGRGQQQALAVGAGVGPDELTGPQGQRAGQAPRVDAPQVIAVGQGHARGVDRRQARGGRAKPRGQSPRAAKFQPIPVGAVGCGGPVAIDDRGFAHPGAVGLLAAFHGPRQGRRQAVGRRGRQAPGGRVHDLEAALVPAAVAAGVDQQARPGRRPAQQAGHHIAGRARLADRAGVQIGEKEPAPPHRHPRGRLGVDVLNVLGVGDGGQHVSAGRDLQVGELRARQTPRHAGRQPDRHQRLGRPVCA